MKLSLIVKKNKVYLRVRNSNGIDTKFSIFDISNHPGDLDVASMAFKNPVSYHHKNFNNYIDEVKWMAETFPAKTFLKCLKEGIRSVTFGLYFNRYHFLLEHGMLKGQLGFKSKSYVDAVGQAVRVYEQFVDVENELDITSGSTTIIDHFYEFARECREDRKLAVSSQRTYFTHIQTIFNYMNFHDSAEIKVHLPIPKKAAKTVHTIPMEILARYVRNTPSKESLWVAHLVTLVQIFSCLRIGDVLRLTIRDLDDETMGVRIRNKKNSTFTYAPLPSEIYNDVKHWMEAKGTLTHEDLYDNRDSNRLRLYNKAIKEVCKGIPAMHIKVDNITQDSYGETKVETVRLCDILTSHNFRKTGATMYRNLGVPDHIIKSMTGHSAGSDLLDTTYTKVDIHSDKIRNTWTKIDGLV